MSQTLHRLCLDLTQTTIAFPPNCGPMATMQEAAFGPCSCRDTGNAIINRADGHLQQRVRERGWGGGKSELYTTIFMLRQLACSVAICEPKTRKCFWPKHLSDCMFNSNNIILFLFFCCGYLRARTALCPKPSMWLSVSWPGVCITTSLEFDLHFLGRGVAAMANMALKPI